jgi:hypothetical protein
LIGDVHLDANLAGDESPHNDFRNSDGSYLRTYLGMELQHAIAQ